MAQQQPFTRRRAEPSRRDHRCANLRPRPRPRGSPAAGADPQPYERELKRLTVCIRLLGALLAASIAHSAVDGLTASGVSALVITAVLFSAAVGLWRKGSRLKRDSSASRPEPASRVTRACWPDDS